MQRTARLSLAHLLILLIASVLSGCAGTISSTGDGDDVLVFALPEATADRIIFAAMKTEFESSSITPVTDPHKGYQAMVQWGIDKDRVTAVMLPARGRNASGELIEGYRFEVNHKGTAPASGIPTSRRIMERLVNDASLVTNPLVLER